MNLRAVFKRCLKRARECLKCSKCSVASDTIKCNEKFYIVILRSTIGMSHGFGVELIIDHDYLKLNTSEVVISSIIQLQDIS